MSPTSRMMHLRHLRKCTSMCRLSLFQAQLLAFVVVCLIVISKWLTVSWIVVRYLMNRELSEGQLIGLASRGVAIKNVQHMLKHYICHCFSGGEVD